MDNEEPEQNGQNSAPPAQTKPWSFFLVFGAIMCVTVIFLVVWLAPPPNVFTESSHAIAALTATFGMIGTLVGTYFGIKASSDARDTVERVHNKASSDARDTVERVHKSTTQTLQQAADRAADAADANRRAAEHTASAANRVAGTSDQPNIP
jgi:hypothetical protein